MKKGFSNAELSIFSGQLSMILHSGISVLEGITILCDDAAEERERQILEAVNLSLQETGSLASALEASGAFPDYMIHMTEIGEQSGTLDEVMDSLASHYEREEAISRSIRDALTYPLVMIGMLAAVLAVLLIRVMPVFRQVFLQLGMELSGTANAFYLLGQSLQRYSIFFFALFFAMAAFIFGMTRIPSGRRLLFSAAAKIPLYRKVTFLLSCSRFSGAMSRALRSGLDMDESFRLAKSLIRQPAFQNRILQAEQKLQEGEDFADTLKQTGICSGLNAKLISVGCRTGSSDLALEKISVSCQEEADALIQNAVGTIEPTIVAVLSVLTGLVLLSVMLPLLGVLSGIG